jgi:non-homologous end joining protein Ku
MIKMMMEIKTSCIMKTTFLKRIGFISRFVHFFHNYSKEVKLPRYRYYRNSEKEHLVALRAYQRGLVMHQLRYLDEIRPMDEIGNLDSLQKVDSKELALGKTLVENLTTEKFDLGQYSDTYAKELEKLIEAKSKGQKVVTREDQKEPEETTDILEALKARLKVKGKPSTSTAAKAKGKMGMAVSK